MRIICFAFLLLLSPLVSAFGKTGHRITGALAELNIDPSTRSAINKIIGNKTLAEASTYDDEMRSDPAEFWQKTAYPYLYVTIPNGKI